MMTQAFVYKWTHIPTLRWYVGSRTAKGCHLNDGYICSSKEVKPLIVNNPEEWIREIIAIGSQLEMRELESEILETVDAMNDPRSFNRHNGDGKFHTIGWEPPFKGVSRSEEFAKQVSDSLKSYYETHEHPAKNVPKNDNFKKLMSKRLKDVPLSEEHVKNLKVAIQKNRNGFIGESNPNFKGIIQATNLETGEVLHFTGNKELKAKGFNPASVSMAINQKKPNNYKNYFWQRITK